MFYSKWLFQALLLTLLPPTVLADDVSIQSFPIVTGGSVASVQNITGETHLFLQDIKNTTGAGNGALLQYTVTGPFTNGSSKTLLPPLVVAPPKEVKVDTLIAVAAIACLTHLRLYFFSPDNVLSEYILQDGKFRGGPSCKDCLTSMGLTANNNSILYAMYLAPTDTFRVGFENPLAPGTLSEAVNVGGAGWSVAPMPNA